jgi:hypothetical protein
VSNESPSSAHDNLAVRFVTGRELAAIEEDSVLEQADLWKQEVAGRCR